ncbi:hypothetical protein [Brevundimonas denitrificans]|uniref:hypothetical protein n=1 Tax=Brevundimonas denitrificans TaxID=1443434 RepID=UPI00223B0449|nr:hypothetical protein [Brevundimonas denitrificans]
MGPQATQDADAAVADDKFEPVPRDGEGDHAAAVGLAMPEDVVLQLAECPHDHGRREVGKARAPGGLIGAAEPERPLIGWVAVWAEVDERKDAKAGAPLKSADRPVPDRPFQGLGERRLRGDPGIDSGVEATRRRQFN